MTWLVGAYIAGTLFLGLYLWVTERSSKRCQKENEEICLKLGGKVYPKPAIDDIVSWSEPLNPIGSLFWLMCSEGAAEARFVMFFPMCLFFPFLVIANCAEICVRRFGNIRFYLWNGKALRDQVMEDYLKSPGRLPWKEADLKNMMLTHSQFWGRWLLAILGLIAWPAVIALGYALVVVAVICGLVKWIFTGLVAPSHN